MHIIQVEHIAKPQMLSCNAMWWDTTGYCIEGVTFLGKKSYTLIEKLLQGGAPLEQILHTAGSTGILSRSGSIPPSCLAKEINYVR